MRALVTGGTGFVGSHIVRALVEAGYEVRVLHRQTSRLIALEGVPYETALGDITDINSLQTACQGIDRVFHVAAVSDYWRADKSRMFDVNVEGTRKVLQAARDNGVKRVIFTSSAGAVGLRENGTPADESVEFNLPNGWYDYGYSKFLAEGVVREFVAEGLDAVILNPAMVMGPGDLNMISGSIITEIKRYRPILPVSSGGVPVTDVRDVARWHLIAAEKGRTGERYLLGTANYPIKTMYKMTIETLGVRRLVIYTPNFLVPAVAVLVRLLRKFRIPVPVDPGQVRMSTKKIYYDYRKAWSEFGEPQIDIEQSLKDTYAWYQEYGYVK